MSGVVILMDIVRFDGYRSIDAQYGQPDEHELGNGLYEFCKGHFTSSRFIRSQSSGRSSIIQYL